MALYPTPRCLYLLAATCALATALPSAHAQLSFTVGGSWPDDAHRQAAVDALAAAVDRYNAYGNFGNYNVYAYYDAGIPTAQASYLGSIGYGRTYPNERVTLHEMSHYLGTGTYGTPWDGARSEALIDQFDGLEATLNGDSIHYWPYGLNYDSEGAEINKQRHVALLYAMRADMGIGPTANPAAWAATSVTLIGNDAPGESGFNFGSKWSDNTFAHPNADYSTGSFAMRTPTGANSWNFVGKSLTVNAGGSLLYNGSGGTGIVTIRNLHLSGGTLRHDQSAADTFQLAGNITLTNAPTIEAARGPMIVSAGIGGGGSLNKTGPHVLTLANATSYAGDTNIHGGTLRVMAVAPVASYTFDSVSGLTVNNTGTGGGAMNGTLSGGAVIVGGGQSGNAVSLAGGASVDINSGIANMGPTGNWTVTAWIKTSTPGGTLLSKSDGGWASGNTVFYLGDGTAGGSGGIPSAVRWGGGFFQGSIAAANVANNAWRQVTYVNTGGTYAIYVDGIAQPLSSGNSSFSANDVGNLVRLGRTTNTVAGDGTINFNGLMDSVHFYNQSLTTAQVAALQQGTTTFSSLPTGTNVKIAPGAVLDVNGVSPQIGSLSGGSGSAVTLGNGRLTVNAASSSTFGGSISGNGGSLVKSGGGTLTLAGPASYTGPTTISGGMLRLASAPVSAAHRWSFNNSLADAAGSSPASIVEVGPNNVSLSASQITLAGGPSNASDYVTLGSGLLPRTNSPVTIELWATPNALQNWSRIFDFGSGTGENLFMSWSQGTNVASDRVEWKDGVTSTANNTAQPFTPGTEYHIAMVLKPVGSSTEVTWFAAPAGSQSLGAARGTFVSSNTLASFFDASDNLGYSFYGSDDTASASYNEVRLWSGALTLNSLQALHAAGPDADLSLVSQVFSVGQLPASTAVSITAVGAGLDLNGNHQTIASLAGVGGSRVLLGVATLTVQGSASTTFGGEIAGPGGLVKAGPSTLILSGTNTYTGTTVVNGGTLVFNPGQNATASLTINAGSRVWFVGSVSAFAAPVTIAGQNGNWTGQLDLSDSALVVATEPGQKASVLATLRDQVESGRAAGAWTGNGITSSTVAGESNYYGLAIADNADLGLTTFRGRAVNENTLLVAAAWFGDANLDQKVNAFDLNLLASHWQQTGRLWSAGDFTGDGKVDAFDLNVLAAQWQVGASLVAQGSGYSAQDSIRVPEPATLAIWGLAIPLLVPRRKKNRAA